MSASASTSRPRVRFPWKIGTLTAPVTVNVACASDGDRPIAP
jgi:hypothetical protein